LPLPSSGFVISLFQPFQERLFAISFSHYPSPFVNCQPNALQRTQADSLRAWCQQQTFTSVWPLLNA
jgi:hypothetical protein